MIPPSRAASRAIITPLSNIIFLAGADFRFQSLSPLYIFIHPPERFVLEGRSTGFYEEFPLDTLLVRGVSVDPPVSRFFHFGDIYTLTNTSVNDLGQYIFSRFPTDPETRDPITENFILEQGT